MKSLASRTRSGEAVIVSTCNRTELYCNNGDRGRHYCVAEEYHGLDHKGRRALSL